MRRREREIKREESARRLPSEGIPGSLLGTARTQEQPFRETFIPCPLRGKDTPIARGFFIFYCKPICQITLQLAPQC